MDYSELVYAVKKDDMKTANRMCGEAIPILKKYLISNVNASPEDAEDAVQKMFEYVIPKIQNDEITSPSGLLSYMLSGARHSYYKIVRDFDLDKYAEMEEQLVAEPRQVWNLVSEDQESILSTCIEKLKGHYQDLITFLFDHPNANTKEIAEYFGISKNNAWTRKHRVIQQLQECVQQYF
ncbi:MAG: hypothetical protein U5K72_03815 [Balneolaceae bacterium]|nr:hypothetical protein [Balneolaceae bacterium]